MKITTQAIKLGILGGGQLGKMLGQAASKWHLNYYVLEQIADCPASVCSNVHPGDFANFEDVLHFGSHMDVISVEIEAVNTEALKELQAAGKTVYPDPLVLETIKDKGIQRDFHKKHNLPQPEYVFFSDADEIRQAVDKGNLEFPFVQKVRTEGYDGRGVFIVKKESDLANLLGGASLVENLVDIDKELAVIAARNESGDIETFDPVELVFDPNANLVDFLFAPARVTDQVSKELTRLAKTCISAYDMVGLLALEFFLDKQGNLLINEVAPRPHNSGHHSIEACYTSQFEQHLRAILNLPLGDPGIHHPAAMLNLLGAPDQKGDPDYSGLESVLAIPGVYPHIYGKKLTKPFRKMGHVTILGKSNQDVLDKAEKVRPYLKVSAAG